MTSFRLRHVSGHTGWTRGRIALAGVGTLVFLIFANLVVALGPMRFLALKLPGLLGFAGTERYLLLLENNAELRPTGGFLTAIGDIRLTFGIPTTFDVTNVYNLDPERRNPPAAPGPIETRFREDPDYRGWEIRDANWFPDFGESAELVIRFLSETKSVDPDHVLAIDTTVLSELLRVTGPIRIGEEEISAESLFHDLTRASMNFDAHDEKAMAERKSLLGALAGRIVFHLGERPWLWDDAFRTLARMAGEKHLLWLARTDVGLAQDFRARGWDGRIVAESGSDVLGVNLANLGGRKSDRYFQRETLLTVTRNGDGSLAHELVLRLRHEGDHSHISNEYHAWARILVPTGSELTGSSGDFSGRIVTETEAGLTSFAFPLLVEPGGEGEYRLQYRVPDASVNQSTSEPASGTGAPDDGFTGLPVYRLRLIKQPGTDADPISVVLRAPEGMRIESADFDAREDRAFYRSGLDEDTTLSATFLPDRDPPLVVEQRFQGSYSRILVLFDEALDESSVNPAEWELTDANVTNPDVTDSPRIESASYFDRGVTLRVRGISDQPLERYRLTIRGVRDASGNEVSERVVTVVQRLEK